MVNVLIVLGVSLLACLVLLRVGLPGFGKKSVGVFLILAVFIFLARLPRLLDSPLRETILTPTYYWLVLLPSTGLLISLFLLLGSSPLWFFLGMLSKRKSPPSAPKAQPADENHVSRRQVLKTLAWSAPAVALATASYGTFFEAQTLRIRRLKLFVQNLPTSLEGLRIGHITDSHISHDFTLIRQMETACERLSQENLDLLVTTGDLCDHAPQFETVTRLLAQIHTRLGHYACLGNHEIHVGLPEVRKAHERADLHLLENHHVQLGDLRIAGVNYPFEGKLRPRMEASPKVTEEFLTQALGEEVKQPFTLLLSHHPHVIRQAKQRSVDLILAGHLHGGQIGLGPRSLIEPIYGYTHGLYETTNDGESHSHQTKLFVSNGLGHWLPFRFNCPPEAVVIELTGREGTLA